MMPERTLNYYSANADQLFTRHQALDSEVMHAPWKKLLPDQPGLACDIGAGSGRDAYWLAEKGWDVVAVKNPGQSLLPLYDSLMNAATIAVSRNLTLQSAEL